MKVYGKTGTTQQTVVDENVSYTPSVDEILMNGERPGPDYVAEEGGEWAIPTPPVPTKEEKLSALDAEYMREKATLCEQYTDSIIHGDSDTADAIVDEMNELDAWYDEEYERIINEEEE